MIQPAVAQTIDLHSHTGYSDGSLSVDELLIHAREYGVETLAITDHDSVAAHLEIANKNKPLGINVISGVEISCQFGRREVHIVGLKLDVVDPALTAFLKRQQSYRRNRLLAYAEKLEKVGILGVASHLGSLKAESVTRTHLSQILVEMGAAQDSRRVFKQLIGRKGRAYVPAQWPELEDVVKVILTAGGIPVIAHPGRYQLARRQLTELMERFQQAGGLGIELAYPNADAQLIRWLTDKALNLGLWASQGADFHNPEWRWVKPGFFPKIPSGIRPVWEMW